MADRRRYTGTQTIQLLWSVLAVGIGALAQPVLAGTGLIATPVVFAVWTGVWVLGLVGIGLRDRRAWNEMVEQSSFQRKTGPGTADLERIIRGRSVAVSTTVPGVLSQTHTEITTSVEGVDASFSVTIIHRDLTDEDGFTTGNDVLDERFVIRGTKQNVARVLSTEVQRMLMDIETPCRWTLSGDRITCVVPFTRLDPDELDTIAETAVVFLERVETLGGGKAAERVTEEGKS